MYLHFSLIKNPRVMDIIKVRLHKTKKGNGLVLTYKKKENEDPVDGVETHKAPIHQDLQQAIDALAIHLACMTFYVKGSQVEDIAMPAPELSEKFHVNGYSIGGDDDNPGIVISGHHIGPNGLAVILNTPFRKFNESPASRYEFMDDLVARVNVIEEEVGQYLNGDKRGEAAAPELPFDDKVTKMKVVPPTEKVTEEGNLAPDSAKHKYANADAMARIAEDDKASKKKTGTKKRVQQTAANPSGEAVEQ